MCSSMATKQSTGLYVGRPHDLTQNNDGHTLLVHDGKLKVQRNSTRQTDLGKVPTLYDSLRSQSIGIFMLYSIILPS